MKPKNLLNTIIEANKRGVGEIKRLFLSEALSIEIKERTFGTYLTPLDIIGTYMQGIVNSEKYQWLRFK